jgi:hypothetical protein
MMSFPVPIKYELTADNNTNVIYSDDKTLSLLPMPFEIESDSIIRYSKIKPETNILSTNPAVFPIEPVNSIIIFFAVTDVTPEPGLFVAFFSINVLYRVDGTLVRTQRTNAISETGENVSRAYVGYSSNAMTIPSSEATVLQAGVEYVFLQIKIGEALT